MESLEHLLHADLYRRYHEEIVAHPTDGGSDEEEEYIFPTSDRSTLIGRSLPKQLSDTTQVPVDEGRRLRLAYDDQEHVFVLRDLDALQLERDITRGHPHHATDFHSQKQFVPPKPFSPRRPPRKSPRKMEKKAVSFKVSPEMDYDAESEAPCARPSKATSESRATNLLRFKAESKEHLNRSLSCQQDGMPLVKWNGEDIALDLTLEIDEEHTSDSFQVEAYDCDKESQEGSILSNPYTMPKPVLLPTTEISMSSLFIDASTGPDECLSGENFYHYASRKKQKARKRSLDENQDDFSIYRDD